MIKGNPIDSTFSDFDYSSLYIFDHSISQDTVKTQATNPSIFLKVEKPKLMGFDTTSLDKQRVDKLFQVAEARDKKLAQSKSKTIKIAEQQDTSSFIGSTSRINTDFVPSYQKLPGYSSESLNTNFLLNIAGKSSSNPYKSDDTAKINASAVSYSKIQKKEIPSGFEGNPRSYDTNGWYILVLLIALSIFAWGKSFYQKYLLQIISSVYNYQISIQLFRDKNALFRNLSIILQILFPINVGLLIYFLIDFYHFNQIFNNSILNIAVYCFGVFLFFRLKAFLYKFLGVLFKTQEDFNEVQHHINVFNQTLGVILLPFVIAMPFMDTTITKITLIGLFGFVGIFLLLFFFRGIQIVTRKQVSFFFLILYLCAIEILPVALLIKTSYAII